MATHSPFALPPEDRGSCFLMNDLIFGLDEVEDIALQVLEWVRQEQDKKPIPLPGSLAISLSGPMGSGKTTLIRAMGKALDCNPLPTSPTFNIIHNYLTPQGELVVHADLFRLRNAQEWLALDPEMLCTEAKWLWVEWPEKAMDFMPPGMAQFDLEACSDCSDASDFLHPRRLRFMGWVR